MRRAVATALVVAAALAGSTVSRVTTVQAARAPFVNVWIPYWDTSGGSDSYGDASAASLQREVSPFFFTAAADGSIQVVGSTSLLASSVNLARQRGLQVIPTVTDGAGKGGMAAILADDGRRAQHIANLVSLAAGYDGVDLDYEQFAFTDGRATWASTMPLWVQFIRELKGQLGAKQLIVTIPPVWDASAPATGNTTNNYWVYAQDQILPFVDRLRLMVYDWSPGTPSANAPLNLYVRPAVAYSSRVADAVGQPRSKLELGVPAYGRHWRQSADGSPCPDGSLGTVSITQRSAPGIAPTLARNRDAATGEVTFSWNETVTGVHTWSTVVVPPFVPPGSGAGSVAPATADAPAVRMGPPPSIVTCTVRHTVWYPDAVSVAGKAAVALNAGWGGIVIWAGSYETSDTYDRLAEL